MCDPTPSIAYDICRRVAAQVLLYCALLRARGAFTGCVSLMPRRRHNSKCVIHRREKNLITSGCVSLMLGRRRNPKCVIYRREINLTI